MLITFLKKIKNSVNIQYFRLPVTSLPPSIDLELPASLFLTSKWPSLCESFHQGIYSGKYSE